MTLGLQFGTNCEHNRQKSSIGDDMAGSVNKVILVGNVGKDPEVRTFGNGGKVANFSIATSESWKDKQTGERKEKTDWHNIAIFNDGLVGIVERYVKKGTKLYIEGQLKTRKWTDRDGNDKYTTEVVLQGYNGNLTLLDSRNSQGGGGYGQSGGGYGQDNMGQGGGGSYGGGGNVTQGRSQSASMQEGPAESFDLDDEIPF